MAKERRVEGASVRVGWRNRKRKMLRRQGDITRPRNPRLALGGARGGPARVQIVTRGQMSPGVRS